MVSYSSTLDKSHFSAIIVIFQLTLSNNNDFNFQLNLIKFPPYTLTRITISINMYLSFTHYQINLLYQNPKLDYFVNLSN